MGTPGLQGHGGRTALPKNEKKAVFRLFRRFRGFREFRGFRWEVVGGRMRLGLVWAEQQLRPYQSWRDGHRGFLVRFFDKRCLKVCVARGTPGGDTRPTGARGDG